MTQEILKNFEARQAEILRQQESAEKELSAEKQKEILREIVSEHINTSQPVPQPQQQSIIQKAQTLQNEPKERQIALLIQLAFEKSVFEAVNVARKLDNPYLLDEFHDALVDKLYNQLVEKGKLKQI
jgi:hypothetical protein